MNLLLTDYLLAVYVVAGLIVAALLGAGIGSTGLTWAVRRATRRADAEARAARAQQRLAEEALDRATHPIGSTDDRPEVDLEALARVVMDSGDGIAALDPEAWVWDTTPAAPAMCGDLCPHGHGHRCARSPKHTYPHRDVRQKGEESCTWWGLAPTGPCQVITSDPMAPESPELYCEHDDGEGHTGRHTAYDGDVEWDDTGDTWVKGKQL